MRVFFADGGFIYPENSQVPNARFQAAAAIRYAAIREWGFLAADDKRSLIRLSYVLFLFLIILVSFTSLVLVHTCSSGINYVITYCNTKMSYHIMQVLKLTCLLTIH
jgi:hypothetical protein